MSASPPSGRDAESLLVETAEELYEGAPCGYLSTRLDGTFVRVNRTFLEWTGHTPEDLVGRRRFADLLSPGGRIYHETHYAPLLSMQGMVREIALELVRADGSRLPVLVNSTLVVDAEGRPVGVRTMVFDATSRREYERELLRARRQAEAADRMKAEFISNVSHEIRTPLGAIMASGHLLESTELTPRQENYVRILRSSSENLLRLIDDILDFHKIEAGRMELNLRVFELGELVRELVETWGAKGEERGIALALTLDESLPPRVRGDDVKLRQILGNLVSNAIKFTSAGSVTASVDLLETTLDAVRVGFVIEDTGIGIAPDRLSRIFDDFTQAGPEIGSQYGGTGLGLAICRRLVELQGGRIEARSEPGRGSTFSFDLWLGRAADEAEEEPDPSDAETLKGLRVLLADDNEANRYTITHLLESWGVEVESVNEGRTAIERVREGDYDIVLMDLRMPEVGGMAATQEIRKLGGRFRRLPILAVSASIRFGDRERIAETGFDGFVGKPIHPSVLWRALAEHSGRG